MPLATWYNNGKGKKAPTQYTLDYSGGRARVFQDEKGWTYWTTVDGQSEAHFHNADQAKAGAHLFLVNYYSARLAELGVTI